MVSYPQVDSIIGLKYKILSVLGKGATACVYKAYHRYLQKEVALKILSPQLVEKDRKIEDIFFEEASHLSKMEHENLITVFDADKTEEYSYIAMEYLKGDTLENLIKEKIIIPPPLAINIIKQVCLALDYSLSFGFVHRDIKPANIMILENNKVKILDFGLSKKIGEPVKFQIIGGPMCGTLFYMSPEQLTDSERVDHRADLYSVGMTLYHMLIGKVPYETNDLAKLVSMKINNDPTPPVNLSPEVSYELSSLIMKLLEKSASKRYSTYGELITDLDAILAEYEKNEEDESVQLDIINDESFILSNLKEKYLQKVKEKSIDSGNKEFSDSQTLQKKYLKNLRGGADDKSSQFGNSSMADSTGLQQKYLKKLNNRPY